MVGQGRVDVLLGGEDRGRARGHEVEEGAEAIDGQELGDVGALVGVLERGDLGQLAVLGRELGRGGDLDPVGLAERALGEGREQAQRLDLVVEQVDAHRPLLGGRVDVEDPAADGELAAVVDLVDALVARGHELLRGLLEVEQLALLDGEPVRAQLGVGDLLGQGDGGDDDDRRLLLAQSVEGGDAQPDQVRRRGQMRLVGDAARGVVAHGPGRQPRAQVGGQVAGGAVVGGDDEDGGVGLGLGQRRDQVRAQGGGHERAAAVAGQRGGGGVVESGLEEGAESHAGQAKRPRSARGRCAPPV